MVQSVVGDLGIFILHDFRFFIVSDQDVLLVFPGPHPPPLHQSPHPANTKIGRQSSLEREMFFI